MADHWGATGQLPRSLRAHRLLKLRYGTASERAAYEILTHGMIEGAHHKQWLLDQTLRRLLGAAYSQVVQDMEEMCGEKWDTGCPL